MAVNKHFDNVSSNYDNNRSSGFLGYLVNKEKKLLLEKLNVKKNELILDAGCGSGYYSQIIDKLGGNVFGVDISKDMIKEYNKKNLKGVVGDIENLSFDNKFDKVFCAGALEFIKNSVKALGSFNKCLNNKGILVLLYPRLNVFGVMYLIYHKLHGVNISLFSNKKIRKLILDSNFRMISNDKANLLTSVLVAAKE